VPIQRAPAHAGLLLGHASLWGIARLGRLYGAPLAHALGFRPGKMPANAMLPYSSGRSTPERSGLH
jgi:hypothetical protein